MKILYIDGVGPFGGASRSLYQLLKEIHPDIEKMYFFSVKGSYYDFYSKLSNEIILNRGITRFDNTKYSYYRGLRWLVLLRELYYLPGTIYSVIKASKKFKGIDIIHVNEITDIFSGLLFKLILGKPLAVHIRSVQRDNQNSMRSRVLNFILNSYVNQLIAIDENVKASMKNTLNIKVLHNSFSIEADKTLGGKLKNNIAKTKDIFTIGFVGNLQESKGIFDLISSAEIKKKEGYKICFLIVGGCAKKFHPFFEFLLAFLKLRQDVCLQVDERVTNNIEDTFILCGESYDLDLVYSSIDVLCFPSHFDAPGRPIFEAAHYSVPSIACISNSYADTFIDDFTGIAVNEKSPILLKNAITSLYKNSSKLTYLGENAKQLADKNFNTKKNAKKLMNIYKSILNSYSD